MRKQSSEGRNIPIGLKSCGEVLLIQFQERLPDKATANVVYRGCQLGRAHGSLELLEGLFDAGAIRTVGADANGLAACSLDLLNQRLIVRGVASKESDGIFLCKLSGDRCSSRCR